LQNISLFFKINFFITAAIYLGFIYFLDEASLVSYVFFICAALSTAATVYLILYLLFRPFFRFHKIMAFVLAFVFLIVDFALIFDFVIYKIWKFHINAMVLNILTSPAAYDSIQIGLGVVVVVASIVVVLILAEYLLYGYINRAPENSVKKYNSFFNKKIVVMLFFVIFTEKITYGISNQLHKESILSSVMPVPLYQPLTFARFLERHFGIYKDKRMQKGVTLKSSSKINYPLNPIELDEKAKSPNIFIFAIDSMKNSILSEDTTPNIINFSKDAIVFNNHFSGGNATRFGIFSLFYGLNATYWFSFLDASREPVLFEVLKRKNYDINIFSSTNTKWPEFRKTVYCTTKECIFDDFEGTPAQKDMKSSEKFMEIMRNIQTDKPIFSFIFLDAPHGYSYPKSYEKYKPNAGNNGINYLEVDPKNAALFKNSYKNALFFNDALLGDMIELLKKRGLYENSIVIITSDHGQEFFEYGSFGHNSSFSKAQLQVPFMLHLPHKGHKEIKKMTSHLDVATTLLKILGVKNPASDYSNGMNMLDENFTREFTFAANWSKNAILTNRYVYVFSNKPNEIFKKEIRESDNYKRVKEGNELQKQKLILKVLEQNRRFVR